MNAAAFAKWTATLLLLLTLGACGGGGDDHGGTGTQPAGTVIGAAGGTVIGPNGASVVIPPGALATNTLITIEQTTAGSPALPGGFSTVGQMFAFTPHNITFAVPVTVTLPFDPTSVPSGKVPALFKTNAQNQWEQLAGATFNANSVSAQVTSFSWVQVNGLLRDDPVREWEFHVLPGNGQAFVTLGGIRHALVGEFVEEFVEFGPQPIDSAIVGSTQTLPFDGKANGYVQSTANGVTYVVIAESPDGKLGTSEPIGSSTRFKQTQSYIKIRDNASLTFTLTDVIVRTNDFNPVPQDVRLLVEARVALAVRAFKKETPNINFYSAGSVAMVSGYRNNWTPLAPGVALSRFALWSLGDFEFRTGTATVQPAGGGISCVGSVAELRLIPPPRVYSVDLSSLDPLDEFTLEVNTSAQTNSRRGGGFEGDCQLSYASAYLRDPLEAGGGVTVAFTGLEPTNRPVAAPQIPELVEPASCVPGPGPNPESGVLQFGAAAFTVDEWAGAAPAVIVTRTGGSSGAVTATFDTSDSTAIGGTDYTPVRATVFFGDGEAGQRIVEVPTIQNLVVAPDKFVNLTLSQPGGCAALGQQTSAVLTIRDDGGAARPPPPSFTIGGTVSGLVGTGLVLQDLHFLPITPGNGAFTFPQPTSSGSPYAVTIVTQPTNPLQICTVTNGSGTVATANITNVAVDCVTPPPSGGLDPGFGGGSGKVTTAFGGAETAMALQAADGKIVMVGGSGTDFLLARYNLDGSLDTSFGSAGLVTSDVGSGSSDEARAVAIQNDGKIVVVGNAVVGRTTNNLFNFDFAVARFNADGSPDTSFGNGGKVTTDFNGQVDRAFAVAIQTDGKIVVVGSAGFSITSGISTDFGVARYNSNGTPDTSFGSGGKLTTDIGGAVDIAQNVVVQPNGAILVSGVLALGSSPVLGHGGLARYDTNGVLDATFGTGGKMTLPNVALGDALALQSDGRIVVAGSAVVGGTFQFALKRLLANGGADGSFGSAGLVTTGFTTQDDFGRAVAIQADGRIVVAGQSSNKSNPDFAIARYGLNGAPDASFGTGGKLTIDFFGSNDGAENVAVQPDGKIVVGGFARNGTRTGYGLVRILP